MLLHYSPRLVSVGASAEQKLKERSKQPLPPSGKPLKRSRAEQVLVENVIWVQSLRRPCRYASVELQKGFPASAYHDCFFPPFISSYCFSEMSPVCAVVGGVLGQEVVKVSRWTEQMLLLLYKNFFVTDESTVPFTFQTNRSSPLRKITSSFSVQIFTKQPSGQMQV